MPELEPWKQQQQVMMQQIDELEMELSMLRKIRDLIIQLQRPDIDKGESNLKRRALFNLVRQSIQLRSQ